VPAALAAIDDGRLRAYVETLAGFGSRHPQHPGHASARAYLEQTLRALGLRVGVHARGAFPRNVYALVGPGDSPDIVLSAHYDSIANRSSGWQPARDPAPGANDNGTGVAGLLEIARVLREEEGSLRRTVGIVFFDGEELSMTGSKAWVADGRGGNLLLNLDMVGFSAPGRRKLDLMRYANSGELPARLRAANDRYSLGLQLVDRNFPADYATWVDSTPFAIGGVPSVTLTESYGQPGIDYPGYPGFHRTSDVPAAINNVPQWRAATQLVLAVALELAR
jgi:Zn-dependent M28 family amino/carboxypeptidase